jgi:hypothetical protein
MILDVLGVTAAGGEGCEWVVETGAFSRVGALFEKFRERVDLE